MNKKKLLALLMALVMTFSLVPVTAFADGTFWVVKYNNDTGVLYAEATTTQPSGTYYTSEEAAIAAYQAGAQATITYNGQTTYYASPAPALSHVNTYTGSTSADDLVFKLFADCNYETYDASFTISVPMTMDLNGHTVAFGLYGKKNYTYGIQKDFILKDTSVGQTGVLYGINNTAAILLGTSSVGSTFTLESGTIKSETAIFDTWDNVTINVTGGKMVSYSKYGNGDSRGIVYELCSGCALNISGGEFRTDQTAHNYDGSLFGHDFVCYNGGGNVGGIREGSSVTITGGSFTNWATQKHVPGYTADQEFSNDNPTITVGDYTITRSTVSSPYGAAEYDVYLYTVEQAKTYVAQIGSNKYETLQAAAAAVANGQTIVMLNDVTEEDEVVFDHNNAAFTLDLAGHTVTVNKDMWVKDGHLTLTSSVAGGKVVDGQNDAAIYVSSNNNIAHGTLTIDSDNVTVEGGQWGIAFMSNSVVNINAGTVKAVSTVEGKDSYAISGNGNSTGATLNITGGTINGTQLGVYFPGANALNISGGTISGATGVYQKSGTMNITGGTINGTGAEASYEYYGNGGRPTGDAIVIDNCGYPNGAPNASIRNADIESAHGKQIGYYVYGSSTEGEVVADTEYTLNTNAANRGWLDYAGGTYSKTIGELPIVAKNIDKDKEYLSLKDAFAEVQNGQTITLLYSVELDNPLNLELAGKSVTLDLGTYTLTGRTNLKSGELTIKNGTVDGGSEQALNVYGSATLAENYSVLNLEEGLNVKADVFAVCLFGPTYSAKEGYGAVINTAANITTDGNGTEGAIFVSGNLGQNIDGDMNNEINITGGEVRSYYDCAIALNGLATVNISGNVEISGNTAIAVKRGTLNVTGGDIFADGDENYPGTPNNNGTEMTGAAISISNTYNQYGPLAVSISGDAKISSNWANAVYMRPGDYSNGADISISGGIFSDKPAAAYIADGYAAMDNDNNSTKAYYPYKVDKMKVEESNTVTVNQDSSLQTGVATEDYSSALNNAGVNQNEAVTVSGVVLTMDKTVDNTTTGVQAVVDAAKTKADIDSNTAFTSSLNTAAKVEIDVDVKVTPTKYEETVKTFELTPYATVKTYATENADTPSASQSDVIVTNDMIDQDQPIFVKLYTGGTAPIMLLHVGESSTETLTPGNEASLTTFKYTDDGYCEFYVSHFSEIKALFSGTNEAYISVSGGSLRRRVLTSEPDTVVNTSADLRLRFKLNNLNTDNITIKYEESYFDWGLTSSLGTTTYLTSSSDEYAALIINGVPSDNFDTEVYCQLHLVYNDGESDHTLVSDVMYRSVSNIANAILTNSTETTKWKDYANFLLGTGDITSYKRSDYDDTTGEKIV